MILKDCNIISMINLHVTNNFFIKLSTSKHHNFSTKKYFKVYDCPKIPDKEYTRPVTNNLKK